MWNLVELHEFSSSWHIYLSMVSKNGYVSLTIISGWRNHLPFPFQETAGSTTGKPWDGGRHLPRRGHIYLPVSHEFSKLTPMNGVLFSFVSLSSPLTLPSFFLKNLTQTEFLWRGENGFSKAMRICAESRGFQDIHHNQEQSEKAQRKQQDFILKAMIKQQPPFLLQNSPPILF